jgi:hypothetical protein
MKNFCYFLLILFIGTPFSVNPSMNDESGILFSRKKESLLKGLSHCYARFYYISAAVKCTVELFRGVLAFSFLLFIDECGGSISS